MVAVAMLGVVVDADKAPRAGFERNSVSWNVSSFSTMESSTNGTGQVNVVAVEVKLSGIAPAVKSPANPRGRVTKNTAFP